MKKTQTVLKAIRVINNLKDIKAISLEVFKDYNDFGMVNYTSFEIEELNDLLFDLETILPIKLQKERENKQINKLLSEAFQIYRH